MIPSEKEKRFTQAMAAAFFDLSPGAFREKERRGDFVNVEDESVVPERPVAETSGNLKNRRYSLYDLRRIAHALRTNGKMSDRQLRIAIMRIDSFAEPMHRRNRKYFYKNYKKRS